MGIGGPSRHLPSIMMVNAHLLKGSFLASRSWILLSFQLKLPKPDARTRYHRGSSPTKRSRESQQSPEQQPGREPYKLVPLASVCDHSCIVIFWQVGFANKRRRCQAPNCVGCAMTPLVRGHLGGSDCEHQFAKKLMVMVIHNVSTFKLSWHICMARGRATCR